MLLYYLCLGIEFSPVNLFFLLSCFGIHQINGDSNLHVHVSNQILFFLIMISASVDHKTSLIMQERWYVIRLGLQG